MPGSTVVLDRDDIRRTLVRIAHEIVEKNPPSSTSTGGTGSTHTGGTSIDARERGADPHSSFAIVGIHRRGAVLAQRLQALTSELVEPAVPLGSLDISFHRDDLGRRPSAPVVHATQLDFPLEGRTVVIVDDVLYTGRTVRAAIDEMFDYGRPGRIQLAVLIDRGHRELPIRPDYVGKNLPTARDERVNVRVEEIDGEEQVTLGPAPEAARRAA